MRIGIFGGSFNPPHKMHEEMAKTLIDRGYLDRVIFVPTSSYYPKAGLISDKNRYEMLALMINDNEKFLLSDYEFGRLTYTHETLSHFQEEYKNDTIYFICGSDNLEEIDTWRKYESILTNFKLLVVPRGHDMEKLLNKYAKYKDNIIVIDFVPCTVASTTIRKYLKEKDYGAVKNLINPKVLEYIIKNNLYVE